MSLADILKKNQLGATSETERASTLLRAKSGKATGPGATPRRTNVAEKLQVSEARAQLGKAQQDKAISDQFMGMREAEQEQREDLAGKEIEQQRQALDREASRKTQALIGDLARHGQTMDTQRKNAKIEQLGFLMSLSDEKHINQLQDVAARRRLDNDAQFKLELQRDVFNGYTELFKDNLKFKSMMKADKREFDKQLAQLDFNTALEIMKANIKAANQQAIWTGIGNAGGTVASTDWDSMT